MADRSMDVWARWLLEQRYLAGDETEQRRYMLEYLYPIRDRVLGNAALAEGETLLDVGAGTGLIAFGALERVGEEGSVIFSDVSDDVLDHSRTLAWEMGVADRCRFVRAPADDLSVLDEASVDAVTTRSVLIYVKDKRRAFEEFHRVLKPGGRLSIFEPVRSFGHPEPPDLFWGCDVRPVRDLAEKVRGVFARGQPPDSSPYDFDERDLLALAEEAGFGEVHLEYHAEIAPGHPDFPVWKTMAWEAFARTARNPLVPTLEEAMEEALTPAERERFVAHLRPLVETGQLTRREARAYLWGANS